MYQKIKAKFKANPTIFYACSIVASWAGVGSLMNFRTLAINNGAAAAMDSIECTIEYDPAVVEAFLHPPNSGQERADDGSFGDEKVL